jgi:hypothetical protein
VTDATPDRVFDGQAAQAGGGGPGGEEEGLGSGVRFTDTAAAKAAHAIRTGTTHPAAHVPRLQSSKGFEQPAGVDEVHADFAGGLG